MRPQRASENGPLHIELASPLGGNLQQGRQLAVWGPVVAQCEEKGMVRLDAREVVLPQHHSAHLRHELVLRLILARSGAGAGRHPRGAFEALA